LATATATAATASGATFGIGSVRAQSDAETPLDDDVDPYFLDRGDLSSSEQEAIIEIEQLQAQLMEGRRVVIPRGLRPERAPTYRLVHWRGEIGDANGQFVSPLSVRPELPPLQDLQANRVNGQILGFHGAAEDWGGRSSQGTLTVELRAGYGGQQMTWFFAQQFDMDGEGFTNIGYEYVAQRDGAPEPVVTDEANVGLRIQLMRSPRQAGMTLRKIIKTALVVTGVPLELENQDLQRTLSYLPPVRVPAMFQEGAALAQAVVGGTAEETPIWRGGFSSYGLTQGGSQLSLRPGYWLVIDAAREPDLRGVRLEDIGGFVSPTRGGNPLDANYIVFAFEMDQGPAPAYFNLGNSYQTDRFRQQQSQNDPFQRQQQGFRPQNDPSRQQQGFPQQDGSFRQQQGFPQQDGSFQQQPGFPQQGDPSPQQQGFPQPGEPFQQQGFPQQPDLSPQQPFPQQNPLENQGVDSDNPFGNQSAGPDDPFSRAVPKGVPRSEPE
jgi:hypothetical protein